MAHPDGQALEPLTPSTQSVAQAVAMETSTSMALEGMDVSRRPYAIRGAPCWRGVRETL